MQSSINATNHFAPKILGILDGPQISEWIKENGEDDLVPLIGKETQWCLVTHKYHNVNC